MSLEESVVRQLSPFSKMSEPFVVLVSRLELSCAKLIPSVVFASLQTRFYSPAPRLAETEPEEDFYGAPDAEPIAPHTTDTEIANEPTPRAPTGPKVELVPFETLRGKINYDTLKALTFKPFQLTAMSEVQKRVLKLMPYLSGGKLRGVAREEAKHDGEEVKENEVEEDKEGERRGREDLLVKAKTGTGKTIVSFCSSRPFHTSHTLSTVLAPLPPPFPPGPPPTTPHPVASLTSAGIPGPRDRRTSQLPEQADEGGRRRRPDTLSS